MQNTSKSNAKSDNSNDINLLIIYLDPLNASTSNDTPSSIKLPNFASVSAKTGWQGIAEATKQNYTHFLIAPASQIQKSNILNKTINSDLWKSATSKSQYHLVTEYKANNAINRVVTGVNVQREAASMMVLNRGCLLDLIAQQSPVDSLSSLIYSAEKSGATELLLNIDTKEPLKLKPLESWKNRISNAVRFYITGNKNPFKWAFLLLSLFSFVYITQTSKKAGISGDEFVQYEYAKLIANNRFGAFGIDIPIDTNALKGQKMVTVARDYAVNGNDAAKIEDPDRLMHLYGSSFDTFTAILAHITGAEDYMGLRHFWNAVLGFLIVLYSAATVRRLTKGSWLWASVTVIVVFFMPRLFGESLNNPKDVPFALGYIMSLYYAIKLYQSFPNYSLSTLAGLIFSLGLGISIRIGGLLSIAIIGLYMGLKYIQKISFPQFIKFKWNGFQSWIGVFFIVAILGYIIGIYVWPYGWDAPFSNPKKALDAFTNYQVSLRQMFEGKLYDSDNLPSHYLVKYLWITLPLGILFGLAIWVVVSIVKRKEFTLEDFILIFSAVFPIFYIYYQGSSVYGGLRHILFTLPSFAILAVMGFYRIQNWLTPKLPIGALLAVGFTLLPASFIAKNGELSYVYFNEIQGGVEGAYGEYEMDYYLASLRPSCDWLIENEFKKNPNKKYEVLTYGMDQVRYYFRNYPNVHVGYTRYDDRSSKNWDYAIFYNAYFDQFRLKNHQFPPVGTVFAPMVSNKPMGCVIKRPSTLDFEAISLVTQPSTADSSSTSPETKMKTAIAKMVTYLNVDKNSSEVMFYLGSTYANMGQADSAEYWLNQSVAVFPENSRSQFMLYQIAMDQKKADKAIAIMDKYIDSRPKDSEGYLMKGQALLLKKDYYGTVEMASEGIKVNPLESRCYLLGAQAFQGLKDETQMRAWYNAGMLRNSKTANEQQSSMESMNAIYESITGEPIDFEKYFGR